MSDVTLAGAAAAGRARARQAPTVWRRLRKSWQARIGAGIVAALAVVALVAPYVAPYDPSIPLIRDRFQGPSPVHPFGTDDLGRDTFSRVVFGSRISLQIGFIAVGISFAAGVTLGLLAGFYPRLDNPIMRTIDVLLAFPGLLLAIASLGALGPSLTHAMIAVGVAGVPTYVRITRSAVLRVRAQEYVEAARAVGVSDARILVRYVLPNVSSEIIVTTTLGLAGAILAASALSFLGLGAQPPAPEWGAMVYVAKDFLNISPYSALFPILAIFATVLGFNFLGDGLRDALDPRLFS